jgi:glycosyltransferase involved in cell wall biosynthesis
MFAKNKYTIVVPVYNSGSGLFQLHQEIIRTFDSKIDYDIVYVDDFSQDDSWLVLKDIKNKDVGHKITIIRLSKNFGQHAATLCGIAHASGDYILTMDDDLAVLPGEFVKLFKEQEITGAQVVYGEYAQHESFGRKFFKYIYKTLARLEGNNKGRGSSFRLLEANLARKLAENHRHFVFIDEFLLWYTQKVSFIKVENNLSPIRKSRYKIARLIDTTGKVILYSTGIPLKFVTYIGFILAFVNSIIGSFFIYRHFIDKIAVKGYASLIVSILFSTGIILFSIGIIAQYLRTILKNINNSPLYHIDEKQC